MTVGVRHVMLIGSYEAGQVTLNNTQAELALARWLGTDIDELDLDVELRRSA